MTEEGGDAASLAIAVDEGVALNTILALPLYLRKIILPNLPPGTRLRRCY